LGMCLSSLACLLAVALSSNGVAFADRYPALELAGDLSDLCKKADDGSKAICFGFISGVFEVAANNSIDGHTSCVPDFTHVSKIRALTLKWISAHPKKDIEPASAAVAEAMEDAFPCKDSH